MPVAQCRGTAFEGRLLLMRVSRVVSEVVEEARNFGSDVHGV